MASFLPATVFSDLHAGSLEVIACRGHRWVTVPTIDPAGREQSACICARCYVMRCPSSRIIVAPRRGWRRCDLAIGHGGEHRLSDLDCREPRGV